MRLIIRLTRQPLFIHENKGYEIPVLQLLNEDKEKHLISSCCHYSFKS